MTEQLTELQKELKACRERNCFVETIEDEAPCWAMAQENEQLRMQLDAALAAVGFLLGYPDNQPRPVLLRRDSEEWENASGETGPYLAQLADAMEA